MPTSYEFHKIPVASVKISPTRQRKEVRDVDKLADSISRIGLLHPIIVTRENELVAGERRWRAFQLLKKEVIPVHYLDELNPTEAQLIELEENIRRVDLTWKENCLAVLDYHNLCMEVNDVWNQQLTANSAGLTKDHVGKLIRIANALKSGDSRLEEATNINAANNILKRKQKRAVQTEIAQISFVAEPDKKPEDPEKSDVKVTIKSANFLKWIESYKGRRFNFVHCDFPYGINYDKTGYSGHESYEKYDDSPEIYFELLHSLSDNVEKIFFPSAHLMFWFSMNHYQETFNLLTKAGFLVNPFPLIWHKDRGVIPDALRGPRRVYETAFFASLGDRQVVKSSPNAFYSQVKKEGHISTKPRIMLEHFFQLFVDDLTEILDPTCGSGTALAAAKLLGARRLVGLDLSKDHVETSKLAVQKVRKSQE